MNSAGTLFTIAVLCLLSACGSATHTEANGSKAPKPPTIDAGAADPVPVSDEGVEQEVDRREQSFVVELDKPHVTADGITITVKAVGHAHEEDGGTTSFFKIVFARGDATKEYSYSFYDGLPLWYVEGRTMGYEFRVESLFDRDDERKVLTDPEDIEKNQKRRITLVPTDAPELSQDAEQERGRELADKILERRGCKGDMRAGSAEGPGVYGLSAIEGQKLLCTVTVAVYSEQVLRFQKHKRRKKNK